MKRGYYLTPNGELIVATSARCAKIYESPIPKPGPVFKASPSLASASVIEGYLIKTRYINIGDQILCVHSIYTKRAGLIDFWGRQELDKMLAHVPKRSFIRIKHMGKLVRKTDAKPSHVYSVAYDEDNELRSAGWYKISPQFVARYCTFLGNL